MRAQESAQGPPDDERNHVAALEREPFSLGAARRVRIAKRQPGRERQLDDDLNPEGVDPRGGQRGTRRFASRRRRFRASRILRFFFTDGFS